MEKIYVIGLGPASIEDLTLEAVNRMKSSTKNFVRTKYHPTIEFFDKEDIEYTSFDYIYNEAESFEQVYESIVDSLIEATKKYHVINYFVPGNPMVAEKTVKLLLARDIDVEIISGVSFIEPILELLGKDPIEGLQIIDGIELDYTDLNINIDTIVTQVYSSFIISEIKLILSEVYGDDYKVYYIQNAGMEDEIKKYLPVYELDRVLEPNLLTSLYIPAAPDIKDRNFFSFEDLLKIMEALRDKDGCPWDKKQTHQSIRSSLVEEAYELVWAIENEDLDNMVEELGDLMFQVIFHAQIAKEEGNFTIYEVLSRLGEKLIYRHPHVFSNKVLENQSELVYNWDVLKYEEREIETYSDRLKDIKGLPSLLTSYKVQKQAGKLGFDWENLDGPISKVKEEFQELMDAIDLEDRSNMEEKLGDLLFSIVNLSRFLKLDPEIALRRTINKFIKRFEYLENQSKKEGKDIENMSLSEMDRFWNQAKKLEH